MGSTYFCLSVLKALWVQLSLLTHLNCSSVLDRVFFCFHLKDQAKPGSLCVEYSHTMVFILLQAIVDYCRSCTQIMQVQSTTCFQPELLTWTSTYPAYVAVTEESQMTKRACRKSMQGKLSSCDLCLVECKMKNEGFFSLIMGSVVSLLQLAFSFAWKVGEQKTRKLHLRGMNSSSTSLNKGEFAGITYCFKTSSGKQNQMHLNYKKGTSKKGSV